MILLILRTILRAVYDLFGFGFQNTCFEKQDELGDFEININARQIQWNKSVFIIKFQITESISILAHMALLKFNATRR